MRNKIRLVPITLVAAILFFPQQVFAQRIGAIPNPVVFPDLESVINFFLSLLRPIIVLALVATLMYGGWVYLNAKDDDSQVAKAKKILTAAVIGFIIIVLAPVVVQLVGSLLGVQGGLFNLQTVQ